MNSDFFIADEKNVDFDNCRDIFLFELKYGRLKRSF